MTITESTYEPIEPIGTNSDVMSELESADDDYYSSEDHLSSDDHSHPISYEGIVDTVSSDVMMYKSGGDVSELSLLTATYYSNSNTHSDDSHDKIPSSTSIAIFNPWDSISRVLGAIFTLGRYFL